MNGISSYDISDGPDPDRASNAPYTIHHEGGSTTVTKNQRAKGGQGNLLGSFTMENTGCLGHQFSP